MITASRVVRKILIDSNLAVSDFNQDWCCALKLLPDGAWIRDNLFAVVEVEGAIGTRYASTSEIVMYPHIRVVCRSTSYDMGYSKMLQLMDMLDMLTDYEIKFNEEEVVFLHKISRQSGILSSGVDSTMRRYLFTLDYEIDLR
jgi:hypothetical protein